MTEMRWLDIGDESVLQTRIRKAVVDTTGSVIGWADWSDWVDVQHVTLCGICRAEASPPVCQHCGGLL